MTCQKLPVSCTCRRPCCARRPACVSSKPRNPVKPGCSWNVTLSLTWTGFTLVLGKRR